MLTLFRHLSLATLAVSTLLAGCTVLEVDRIDYKSAGKGPSLEVPPDLTALSRDTRYTVPGSSITASGYAAGQTNVSVPTAAASISDVRIERAGNQRWLVVPESPDKVWPTVKEFWQENGFLMKVEMPEAGDATEEDSAGQG